MLLLGVAARSDLSYLDRDGAATKYCVGSTRKDGVSASRVNPLSLSLRASLYRCHYDLSFTILRLRASARKLHGGDARVQVCH